MRAWMIGGFAALALAAGPALAGPVEEVRTAVLYHDVLHPGSDVEEGADIEVEVVFNEWAGLKFLGRPKVNLAVAGNTAGDTNWAAAGLVWDKDFNDRWFGELQFGYAVHDGELEVPAGVPPQAYKDEHLLLGSRDLFRSAAVLGYRIDEDWSVAVEWVHLSHGEILADGLAHNQGIDAAGIRIGRRFK